MSQSCAICFNPVSTTFEYSTPCCQHQHEIHWQCFYKSMMHTPNFTCPLCRQSVPMVIRIMDLVGRKISLNLFYSSTLDELAIAYQERTHIPKDQFMLIFAGKPYYVGETMLKIGSASAVYPDTTTMYHCRLFPDTVLHAVFGMKGD